MALCHVTCPKPPVPSSQRDPSGLRQISSSLASSLEPSTLRLRPGLWTSASQGTSVAESLGLHEGDAERCAGCLNM